MHPLVPPMSSAIKFRIITLGLGLALLGALIVAVVLTSQKQADDLSARLNQVDLESFGIAQQFKDSVRVLGDKMRTYRRTHDAGIWEDFLDHSHQLEGWISRQSGRLTTQAEKDALAGISSALADYLRLTHNLHDQFKTAGTNNFEFETGALIEQNRRLRDLGQALARAHFDSRNQLVTQANRTLTQLRYSILGLLALLFIFGIALAWSVSRHMIAPLQIQLGESRALAERSEKLASLGMLAAGVAHEIRNPLTALKTALFLQQKRLPYGSPERADADLVQREILRLERIVDNFLQFARPADPELIPVLADTPLREVQQLLAAHLAETGTQLIHESAAPLRIKIDRAQMKQVLINLIQNAADSVNGHGMITLRARKDRKRLSSGDVDVIVLEVVDNGTGISSEIQKRLFDPFFTTKAKGVGLGLPIAARIVEKHGGVLQYQTQLNRGTTFGVVLPECSP